MQIALSHKHSIGIFEAQKINFAKQNKAQKIYPVLIKNRVCKQAFLRILLFGVILIENCKEQPFPDERNTSSPCLISYTRVNFMPSHLNESSIPPLKTRRVLQTTPFNWETIPTDLMKQNETLEVIHFFSLDFWD